MGRSIARQHTLKNRSVIAGFFLLVVTAIGTFGYYLLGYLAQRRSLWTLGDCLYMTIITCVVVICRQLNPRLPIISSCKDAEFAGKLELIGAEVVMPNVIVGLRIASQMLRPQVVGYLDLMLRDKNCPVRIENLTLSDRSNLIGQPLSAINFDEFGPLLLVMAIIRKDNPQPLYNPLRTVGMQGGDLGGADGSRFLGAFPTVAWLRKERWGEG